MDTVQGECRITGGLAKWR